ncbi:MAG TPA: hypothetical protein VHH73_13505, partial [Verrucomicrobiae bacterium]|nr:hypothetical protein [Verrucomicrobiae bacterium]
KTVNIVTKDWTFQRRALAGGANIETRFLVAPEGNLARRTISLDGRWIASGMRNGDVFVHDTTTDAKPFLLAGHKEMIVALAVSPDNRLLLTGCIDRTARLWDLVARKVLHIFEPHRMAVGAVAFSPDGSRIATGSWDDTARVWDTNTRRQLAQLGGHDGGVQALAFAPDNRTLASITGTSVLKFWSLAAEREAGMVQLPQGVHQAWLSFSSSGEWAAAVSQAEVLTLLRAPREKTR